MKPAKSRENKKVFVGGLPSDYSESDLRLHFETYGKVEDIEWPFDKMTKARRNFAFIVFEEEQAADLASAQVKQTFGSRECDVKKAVPQGRRFPGGLGRGGIRPYGRGANNTAAWYNNWAAQMHAALPYGAWGDWYGNSFAYQQNGNTAGYGAAGYPTAASNGGSNCFFFRLNDHLQVTTIKMPTSKTATPARTETLLSVTLRSPRLSTKISPKSITVTSSPSIVKTKSVLALCYLLASPL